MNLIRLAAIAALILGGQAMGQSVLTLTAELGGDNNVVDWEDFLDTAFVPGSSADGQVFPLDNGLAVVTWDVVAALSGVQTSDGLVPNGISNVVFHLELYKDGVLVGFGRAPGPGDSPTGPGFFSTTNDGDADGLRRAIFGADPLHNAAFARSFAADLGAGPGRLWDKVADGGPRLDRKQFPSAAGHPAGSTAANGKLVGMGAGFSQYVNGGTENRTPGVGGLAGTASCELAVVPVACGQIALQAGCYTLKVVPGTGNNVLRGDFLCETEAPGSFAYAVDQPLGSEIDFIVGVGTICDVVEPVLTAAASRREHTNVGAFDVDVPINGTPAIESRQNGSAPQMVLTYDSAPADPGCGGVAIVGGSCGSTSVAGNDLIINMNYDQNACVQVTVGGDTVSVQTHEGNVNGDAAVNVVDLQDVKGVVFDPVDATNAGKDVNCDGVLNVVDLQDTKGNVFEPLPVCP